MYELHPEIASGTVKDDETYNYLEEISSGDREFCSGKEKMIKTIESIEDENRRSHMLKWFERTEPLLIEQDKNIAKSIIDSYK